MSRLNDLRQALADNQRANQFDHHEPSLWLRNEIAALSKDWNAGLFTTCGHNYSRMVAALWKPHTIVCGFCTPTLLLNDTAEDWTCDRCRAIVPTINVAVIELDWLLLCFGFVVIAPTAR
jgi:hypothetical protein